MQIISYRTTTEAKEKPSATETFTSTSFSLQIAKSLFFFSTSLGGRLNQEGVGGR